MSFFTRSQSFLEKCLTEKQISAVACLVEKNGQEHVLYSGHTAHENTGAHRALVNKDSFFDLASLTKILVTVNLLFIAESEDRLQFSDIHCLVTGKRYPDRLLLLCQALNRKTHPGR